MKITLTPEESEEYFYNSLCNILGYWGGYGLVWDWDKKDYAEARKKLTNPCMEDVLMQILRDGKSLNVIDEECEGEYNRSITLKDIHEKVQTTPIKFLTEMIEEQNDVDTADAILQTVFFNEIIFG